MRGTHHRYFTIGLRRPLATPASITFGHNLRMFPREGGSTKKPRQEASWADFSEFEHERLDWKNQAQKAPTEGRVNFPPSGSDSGGVVPFP